MTDLAKDRMTLERIFSFVSTDDELVENNNT